MNIYLDSISFGSHKDLTITIIVNNKKYKIPVNEPIKKLFLKKDINLIDKYLNSDEGRKYIYSLF